MIRQYIIPKYGEYERKYSMLIFYDGEADTGLVGQTFRLIYGYISQVIFVWGLFF